MIGSDMDDWAFFTTLLIGVVAIAWGINVGLTGI